MIEEIVRNYEAARKEFMQKGQEAMKNAFKQFFGENPEVKQVAWTQYTPFFNDGEECVFRVNDFCYSLNEDASFSGYEDSDENGFKDTYDWKKENDPVKQKVIDFANKISSLPDELFKDVFGDHCKVVVSREGFDVEVYEHD